MRVASPVPHEDEVFRGEGALDLFGAVTDDDGDGTRRQRAGGIDHVRDQRTSRKRVQHLGQRGVHALALSGSEDHDVERGRHEAGGNGGTRR
jgi:hypothetical protein